VKPLVVCESGRLARGSAGDQKIYSGLHLPRHQVAQGCVVNRAILMKGSDQRGTAATELHANKITRTGIAWERLAGLQLPPYILEVVEALLAGNPLRRAHRTVGKALARLGVMTEINLVSRGV